jgi:hemoglobin/transferrin/lactoferrin receptor protein
MRRHSTLPALLSGLALVMASAGLHAEDPAPKKAEPAPKKAAEKAKKPKKEDIPSAVVVVSATRTERAEKETTTTVTVSTEKELERQLVGNIIDLTRFEAGVEVGNDPSRKGASTYSIRGIGGNRVLIQVDGVTLPDGAEAGRGMSRDYVDVDALKRVEILRGGGSALYGSDALAGVVTYTTKDAADVLSPEGRFGGGLKVGYASVDNQKSTTATVAGRVGNLDGIVVATRRQGNEYTPILGTPNPLNLETKSLLAKLGWKPNEANQLRLGFQSYRRNSETNLLSLHALALGFTNVYIVDDRAKDDNRRDQINLEHVFEDDSAFLQRVEWRAFYQTAKSLEHTDEFRERRSTSPYLRVRYTDYTFDQTQWGLRSQAERRFSLGGWAHRLLFGIDLNHTEVKQPYDRTELTLSGTPTTTGPKTVAGQLYPIKLIPDSTTTTTGAFIQAEVLSPNGMWSVVPGLRFDRYSLTPHPDADYLRGNVTLNATPAEITNSVVTPKLGVVGKWNDMWSSYAQFAQGFRNPPYDYTNFTMFSPSSGYVILPNPNLKPERSTSLELGMRGEASSWSASFAIYHNRYRNFITDVILPDPDPVYGLQQFQYQNVQDAKVQGAELRAGCVFLEGWRSNVSMAYAKGENLNTGKPINSIAPLKSVLGLGYHRGDAWGVDATLTSVTAKSGSAVDQDLLDSNYAPRPHFLSPGFNKLDVIAFTSMKWNGSWRLQGGVFNALNRTYWRWEEVRNLFQGDSYLPRFSQPGRNFSVSLTYSWK